MATVLESLFDDIARARERIWISTYIYRNDLMGHRFADAFAGAVRRGVDVRLLYDALGSHATPGSFFEDMRARDPTSLRCVSEANLIVKQPAFVRDAALLFERDMERSAAVRLDDLPRQGVIERVRSALWSVSLDLLEPRHAGIRRRGELRDRDGGLLQVLGV
ncbi:uncharacterized protein SOCEGT47_048440 [Sorangium cellulosum]|uniref:Phospholipase D-like domain-containing protein n=1 Tax=Sorangium cellulosum TaxID=56 RepID=A0A4P2Q4J9_SORCE|nr:hypothetical protein [Sorangium cellulosum]AUX24307.1 uncharacterized protein SOCEGT47_048440 [Sorangium cellulosum]